MLLASQIPAVSFASKVGVAPATTTMTLGAAAAMPPQAPLPSVMPSVLPGRTAPDRVAHVPRRYYVPYASIEDLRAANAGLGLINESDAWLTGRPYGLPGTATIRLTQAPGGYHSPQGYHYDASMVGGGFGDADTANIALQMQQLVETQKAQQAALKRIAFWQTAFGVMTVSSVALGALLGVATYMRRTR